MSIAFLPNEVPNDYPQPSLLSSTEDGIQGEGFGHLGEWLSFPGSLPCLHVIKLLFDFLCYLPHVNLILGQLEELERSKISSSLMFITIIFVKLKVLVAQLYLTLQPHGL